MSVVNGDPTPADAIGEKHTQAAIASKEINLCTSI
jgi:hypothetical protein